MAELTIDEAKAILTSIRNGVDTGNLEVIQTHIDYLGVEIPAERVRELLIYRKHANPPGLQQYYNTLANRLGYTANVSRRAILNNMSGMGYWNTLSQESWWIKWFAIVPDLRGGTFFEETEYNKYKAWINAVRSVIPREDKGFDWIGAIIYLGLAGFAIAVAGPLLVGASGSVTSAGATATATGAATVVAPTAVAVAAPTGVIATIGAKVTAVASTVITAGKKVYDKITPAGEVLEAGLSAAQSFTGEAGVIPTPTGGVRDSAPVPSNAVLYISMGIGFLILIVWGIRR